MINTIIIDDDINYIKYLINNVINKFNNIKISYIATDGATAIDIIKRNRLDLIIIDLKMPNISGIDVIEKIKSINLINVPKIIVISGELELIYCIKNNYLISDIIYKNKKIEFIDNKIKNLVEDIVLSKELKFIKEKIIKSLLSLGYNFKYKGTQYLYQTILYIYEQNNMDLIENLESNVYKYIAYKYEKTILNIKTNIINSTRIVQRKNKYITPKFVISNILIDLSKTD